MMKLKVREIAEKVGIKNAAQLRARTGLGMKTSYQLWNGETELVSLQTLNTLCNVLQCGPALLLEYTPDLMRITAKMNSDFGGNVNTLSVFSADF